MILADKLWIVILEGTEKSSKALSTYVVFLYNSLFQNNRLNILQILWDSQRGFSIPLSHGVSLSKWLYNAFKRRPYRETYKCFVSWYFVLIRPEFSKSSPFYWKVTWKSLEMWLLWGSGHTPYQSCQTSFQWC